MSRTTSDLPFGSEFSPSQIELPVVLELAKKHEGDSRALEAAILERYFSGHAAGGGKKEGIYNRGKLANNCKLGLIAYRVIDRQGKLTSFGNELFELRSDEEKLYRALARHILLNLNGMAMVQCIEDMTVAGEEVNLTTLRHALAARSIHYPPGGKHPSMVRLWLEKAGVFVGSRWQIDDIRLQEVLGTNTSEFEILAHFTAEQRAFLRALANTGITSPQPANEIARLASATYGVQFPEKSLPKLVLHALVDAGYIKAEKTTSGRGAKPFLVSPTPKLDAHIVGPLIDQLREQTDPKLLDLLRKPLEAILLEMESPDRQISGLALEALAFKLMRLLDMTYVATRLRAQSTGGAEVDLIFQSARLVFSRWQVQCKNTGRVSLDDVAKEVGLSRVLKSSAILVVTTGEIGRDALRYARITRSMLPVKICYLGGDNLKSISKSPHRILDLLLAQERLLLCRKEDFSWVMGNSRYGRPADLAVGTRI
jgi:hypothetical protein